MSLVLEQFRAVTLDFDGVIANTLVHYSPLRKQACIEMYHRTGDERYVQIPDKVHDEAHKYGNSTYQCTEYVLAHAGIVVVGEERPVDNDPVLEVADIRLQLSRDMIEKGEVEPIEGSVEFIRKSGEVLPGKIAVGTTAHRELDVIPFLRLQGLDDVIDPELIVGKHEVAKLKPEPECYLETARRMGLKGNEGDMVVVEDLPSGVEAANKAGAFSVAIATTHSVEHLFARELYEKANMIVSGFKELGTVMLSGASEEAVI